MDYPLGLNPESIHEIIDRAHQVHAKDAIVTPTEEEAGDEDWGAQILSEHAGDPSVQAFRLAIEDLEPDQQMDLVALMWLGRGDFSEDEWESARAEAAQRWTPRTAEYLIGTPLVADYLAEGLEILGASEE